MGFGVDKRGEAFPFKGKMPAKDLIGLLTEKPRVFRAEVIIKPSSCDIGMQKATQSSSIATACIC
jgi:hypothetical protein